MIFRTLLIGLFVLSISSVLAQNMDGIIRVSAFYNSDNKIKNNIELKQLHLVIIDSKTNDTIVNGNTSLINKKILPRGYYKLIAEHDNFKPILLEEVQILSDRMSFVDLLFEPKPRYRKNFQTGIKE